MLYIQLNLPGRSVGPVHLLHFPDYPQRERESTSCVANGGESYSDHDFLNPDFFVKFLFEFTIRTI